MTVSYENKKRRGCKYCLYYKQKGNNGSCQKSHCPYAKELDKYEDYEDYMKTTDDFLKELLKGDE